MAAGDPSLPTSRAFRLGEVKVLGGVEHLKRCISKVLTLQIWSSGDKGRKDGPQKHRHGRAHPRGRAV